MKQKEYTGFLEVFKQIKEDFLHHSQEVKADRWQGMNIKDRPDYISYELMNYGFTTSLNGEEELELYQDIIQPNLPWADDHFLERVCGEPINPGKEWANWPWGKSAAKHRDANEQFNHNYMQRYWPKYAHLDHTGTKTPEEFKTKLANIKSLGGILEPMSGIRHVYGDMMDIVEYLVKEPLTRQAWIPIFFPEDTGFGDGGRKPCTLGYQFIMRNNKLSVYYPLRSCDFIRHFRDDIYLTVRLLIWVLQECRKRDPETWNKIVPGSYTMHCTSLHIFTNDWMQLFGKKRS